MPRVTERELRTMLARRAAPARRRRLVARPERPYWFDVDLACWPFDLPSAAIDVRFWTPGEPVAKKRPRLDPRSGRIYTPSDSARWERRVADRLVVTRRRLSERTERLGVRLRFRSSIDRWRDVDNLAKAVLDALNGKAYADDRQIDQFYADVDRTADEQSAGVETIVYRLSALAPVVDGR